MGHTDIRGTAPLERIVRKKEKTVGVVGLTGGAGVTFICSLLKREGFCSESGVRIVDMGEERDCDSINSMLVVADCLEEVGENFPKMIKHLTKSGTDFGMVLNKYDEERTAAIAELCEKLAPKIPVFKVPFVEKEKFTDLYNYVFYS